MKHTSLDRYPTPLKWDSAGWLTVYRRNQNIDKTNWVTFYLDTPFPFNGTNNVMVDFSFNNDSYSSDGMCLGSETKAPCTLFARMTSASGDPLFWVGTNAPPPRLESHAPNIQFVIESDAHVFPTHVGPFVGGIWTGEVSIVEPATNVFLRAVDEEGHAGIDNIFVVGSTAAGASIITPSSRRAMVWRSLYQQPGPALCAGKNRQSRFWSVDKCCKPGVCARVSIAPKRSKTSSPWNRVLPHTTCSLKNREE